MKKKSPLFSTAPDFSDEEAYRLCLFLNEFLMRLENHYSMQLQRYSQNLEQELEWRRHDDYFTEDDLPF